MSYLNKLWWFLSEQVEEFILLAIVILNVIDFFQALSPTWDFIKKIVSWTLLGFLLKRLSISNIIFGRKHRNFDTVLIITYFSLILKDLIHSSSSLLKEMAQRPPEFWARISRIESLPNSAQFVHEVPVQDQALNLSAISDIPVGNTLAQFIDKINITWQGVPHVQELYLNFTNNLSSQLAVLEPRFHIHAWLNVLQQDFIGELSILFGAVLMIILALYATLRIDIRRPSMMSVIKEEGPPPEGLQKRFTRFLVILIILNFFYIAVFNFIVEWLGMSLDAPIVLIGVFFYFVVWVKYHKKFRESSLIYRMGSFGERFYERVVSSLHSRKGLMLAVSAMIVLHLLTELGIFMIPYTTGIKNPMYFEYLGPDHNPAFSFNDVLGWEEDERSLFSYDYDAAEDAIDRFNVAYIYIMNVLAMVFLLFIPAYLWYTIFMGKKRRIRGFYLMLFAASVFIFLTVPIFSMSQIPKDNQHLRGVDIQTQPIPEIEYEYLYIVLGSIVLGLVVLGLSFSKKIRRYMTIGCVLVSMIFFIRYIYLFSTSISTYYIEVTGMFISGSDYFMAAYFLIFFTMTLIFYVFGTLFFFWELIMDQKDKIIGSRRS
jgi:hypothetical protein